MDTQKFDLKSNLTLVTEVGTNIPTGVRFEVESVQLDDEDTVFSITKWGGTAGIAFHSKKNIEVILEGFATDGRPSAVLIVRDERLLAALVRDDLLLRPVDSAELKEFRTRLASENCEWSETLGEIAVELTKRKGSY